MPTVDTHRPGIPGLGQLPPTHAAELTRAGPAAPSRPPDSLTQACVRRIVEHSSPGALGRLLAPGALAIHLQLALLHAFSRPPSRSSVGAVRAWAAAAGQVHAALAGWSAPTTLGPQRARPPRDLAASMQRAREQLARRLACERRWLDGLDEHHARAWGAVEDTLLCAVEERADRRRHYKLLRWGW